MEEIINAIWSDANLSQKRKDELNSIVKFAKTIGLDNLIKKIGYKDLIGFNDDKIRILKNILVETSNFLTGINSKSKFLKTIL